MPRNPYVPPTRLLDRKKNPSPYLPAPRALTPELVPERPTLALDTFVQDILDVPPRKRSSFIATLLGEKWDLGRRAELVDARTRLLTSVETLLTRTSSVALTDAKLRLELETAVKRARLELEVLDREHQVKLAKLDAELAVHKQTKKRADDD